MRKILFVLKFRPQPYDASSGTGQGTHWGDEGDKKFLSSGLYNSASFVCNMLKSEGIETKIVHVADNNQIHREIMEFSKPNGKWEPVTDVIIEAFWSVPEKFDELKRVCPNVRFIIRNHSETPFLALEGVGFDWTLRYLERENVLVSCNAPRMLDDTRSLLHARNPHWSREEVEAKTPYLPNYYPLHDASWAPLVDDKPWIDVGCFGAIRPLKNHVTQAIAAIQLAEKHKTGLRFHINAGRIEMNGSPILNNLRGIFSKFDNHHLVEHGWKSHHDFKHLLREMDVVTQVSMSETFNIVGADAVSLGIPLVGTAEIPWMSNLYHADPTSTRSISGAMDRAFMQKKIMPMVNFNIGGLHRYNENSRIEWLRLFG